VKALRLGCTVDVRLIDSSADHSPHAGGHFRFGVLRIVVPLPQPGRLVEVDVERARRCSW
jgi:hypothetical protein